MPRLGLLALSGLLILAGSSLAAEPHVLRIDLSRTNGLVRPLHGINKGPLAMGGMIDLTQQQRELAIPFTRLHDCQWPYPEVVDMHAIFRDPGADPEQASSYDWALTDAYLAALQKTGSSIVYRLGESIEHGPVKRFVHPPKDYERWAQACAGIIRHYNEGWANGARYNIRYWEIWNEPENRPQMWSGSDEDYFRLYRAAARVIKARFPTLKVGGPAVGYSGAFQSGHFVASAFVTNFLAFCKRESVPLDFFSWHCYTADPAELSLRARAIRELLTANGFAETESHLNEWNYLPDNSWEAFSPTAAPALRERFYRRMGGAEGAAFVALALSELQDQPVDICNFYHGELGPFGIFNELGATNQVYTALRFFQQLVALRSRAGSAGEVAGRVGLLAAVDEPSHTAAVLVSNFRHDQTEFSLQLSGWKGPRQYTLAVADAQRPFTEVLRGRLEQSEERISISLSAPGIALVRLEGELQGSKK